MPFKKPSIAPRLTWLALLAATLLAIAAPASLQAQDDPATIATVVAVRGDVVARDATGHARKLGVKSTLNREDTVVSGNDGKVQLLFRDNTIISLGRQTEMQIAEYEWKADEKQGAMKTKVTEGTFRVMGGAITQFTPKNFTTETPTATIGIRGSMYAGTVTADSLSVVFQGGKGIDITNPAGTVVLDRPGLGTHVLGADQAPLPPAMFSAEDLATIDQELTGERGRPRDQEDQEDQEGQEGGKEAPPDQEKPGPVKDKDGTPPEGEPKEGREPGAKAEPAGEPGAEPPPGAPGPTEGDSPPPPPSGETGALPPPPGAPPPDGESPPPLAGGLPPPPPVGTVFLPEGELAFMPETTMLAMTGEPPLPGGGLPPPPLPGTVPPPPGAPLPPPPDGMAPPPPGTQPPPPDGALAPPLAPAPMLAPMMAFAPLPPPPNVGAYYDPALAINASQIMTADPTVTPTALPSTGLSQYSGTFTGTNSISGTSISGVLFMEVNWAAGKFYGIMEDNNVTAGLAPKGPPVFFYGSLSGNAVASVKVFGSDGGDPNNIANGVSALIGSGTGKFLGANAEFFDMDLTGTDYSLANPSNLPSLVTEGAWTVSTTTQRLPPDPADSATLTGKILWQGFAVGISENVAVINVDRKLFMNQLSSNVRMTLDRTNGLIDGSLFASAEGDLIVNQVNGNQVGLLSLDIGGTYGSAYVFDDALVAELGCPGTCINDDLGNLVAPHPVGNALITEDPARQISEFMTWGYWESAHAEPDGPDPDASPDMYHTHIPYSMWIAGQKTPTAYVQNLISNTTFVGNYSGFAKGSRISSTGVEVLTNGQVNLTVNFANAGVASAITGAISFDQTTLTVNSPASILNQHGFGNATITNPGVVASSVNGTFYGPQANSLGGNFYATKVSESFLGIFGANLTNTPPP